MSQNCFSGVTTLLATPFEEDGSIDRFALTAMIEKQFLCGNSVALCSDLSEKETMTEDERLSIVEEASVCSFASRRFFVCLSPSDGEKALDFANECASLGCAGFFVSVSACPPEGLFLFFKRLCETCRLPVAALREEGAGSAALCAELSSLPLFEAIAEKGEKPAESAALQAAIASGGRATAERPGFLCAREELAFLNDALGRTGLLSCVSGIFPYACSELARKKGRARRDALERFAALFPLLRGVSAPARLKWALHRQGVCLPTVRLPLVEPDGPVCAALEAALAKAR